jgi:hypothetical protein
VYYRSRKGRPSRSEQVEAINRSHDFVAGAIADPQKAQAYREQFKTVLPPKREKIRRPVDGKPVLPLESAVNDAIYDEFKKRPDVRLWRNNRGVAMYGQQQVRYGVGPRGASDWIGYRMVTITEKHVGATIAQFVALEAKRLGEVPDDDQQKFIDRVNADGGCAGWADSVAKAKDLLP